MKFYNIFKKEISIDQEDDLPEKEKNKRTICSSRPTSREKNIFENTLTKFNKSNLISLNKNRNKYKIIFENKNIVINDITKKYEVNNAKPLPEKKKVNIINKIKNDNITKYKNESTETELNKVNININNNNTKKPDKLNIEIKNGKKNNYKENSRNILKHKQSKKLLKSSFNQKIIDCMEKKKLAKNILTQNKNKNFNVGDSYEFNFTFNNYNSNFTYNNLTEKEILLKNNNKSPNKIVIENYSNEKIINKFKLLNPSIVKNNILGGIKNMLNRSKNDEKKITVSKNIGKTENLRKKNKKDKNYYATKIQKIFRGYAYRKKNQLNSENKNNNNIKCNFGIYIRKKILNNRNGVNQNININININNTDNKLFRRSFLKERSKLKFDSKKIENKSEIDSENKIEEIIIDKRRIYNALNPLTNKNIKEIKINNSYSLRNNRRTIYKFKILRYFNAWRDITKRKIIIQNLIRYIKNKRNSAILNNIDFNSQKSKRNRMFHSSKRSPIKKNNFI